MRFRRIGRPKSEGQKIFCTHTQPSDKIDSTGQAAQLDTHSTTITCGLKRRTQCAQTMATTPLGSSLSPATCDRNPQNQELTTRSQEPFAQWEKLSSLICISVSYFHSGRGARPESGFYSGCVHPMINGQ